MVILPSSEQGIPVGKFGGSPLFSDTSFAYDELVKTTYGAIDVSVLENGEIEVTDAGRGDHAEHYVDFYLSKTDKNIYLSDMDYLMIDMDIDVSYLYDEYRLLSVFRRETGGLAHNGYHNLYINKMSDGNYFISTVDSTVLWKSYSPKLHLTIIYSFNHDDLTASEVYWYVDGNYIGSATSYLREDAFYAQTFRVYGYGEADNNDSDMLIFSDYQVHSFDRGYDGALNYLFDNTKYTLFECSDSVLFDD